MKQYWTRIVGDDVKVDFNEDAREIMGYEGAMLSSSKADYRNRHPDHELLFNANIFNKKGIQIWYGDLDITESEDKLQELANRLGTIYVTPELPYRFEGLDKKGRGVKKYTGR